MLPAPAPPDNTSAPARRQRLPCVRAPDPDLAASATSTDTRRARPATEPDRAPSETGMVEPETEA